MSSPTIQALVIYALAFAISAAVAGMIKVIFLVVRWFSRPRRE